jgi:hypothetical protein
VKFPAHVVRDWLSNSEAVAMKHYLQTTDDHFSRAAGGFPKAKQSRAADDDDPANPKADARSKAKQKAKQSGAAKARTDSLRERASPTIAERNDTTRNPATTQADGVGFEPTNDFRRCRFSRSASPLGVLPIRTPRKQGRNAPEAVLAGTSSIRPERRNRDNPRHDEPNRDHSPDKSATSRARSVPK